MTGKNQSGGGACIGLFDRAVRGHITGKVMLKQISDRSEGTSNMDIRARMFPVERTANAMGPCRVLPECLKNCKESSVAEMKRQRRKAEKDKKSRKVQVGEGLTATVKIWLLILV